MEITSEQLEKRHPVWLAMSEHYLDTETRPFLLRTAKVCLDAQLEFEAAADIWRYEITPLLYRNLRQPAGEWAGFDEEWIYTTCTRCLGHNHLRSEQTYLGQSGSANKYLLALERIYARLLPLNETSRADYASQMQALAMVFFDFHLEPRGFLPCSTHESWRDLFASDFFPLFSPLLLPAEESAGRQRVDAWIKRSLGGERYKYSLATDGNPYRESLIDIGLNDEKDTDDNDDGVPVQRCPPAHEHFNWNSPADDEPRTPEEILLDQMLRVSISMGREPIEGIHFACSSPRYPAPQPSIPVPARPARSASWLSRLFGKTSKPKPG